MSERFEVEQPTSAALPPRELWLHDPEKFGRIDVSYDQFGFVDIDRTLQDVIETIDPSFDWQSDYADPHHAQHDFRDYLSNPHGWLNEREFRNSPTRQVILNRVTHAWWHKAVNKPLKPKPSQRENMRYAIDAINPIRRMRQSYEYVLGREVVPGDTRFTNAQLHEFSLRLGYFCDLLERLDRVPKEFRIVDIEAVSFEDVEDMIRITQMFAHFTKPRTPLPLNIVRRDSHSSVQELIAA